MSAREDLDERRLAGAVLSDQGEHLARCDGEAHVLQRIGAEKSLAESAHFDSRSGAVSDDSTALHESPLVHGTTISRRRSDSKCLIYVAFDISIDRTACIISTMGTLWTEVQLLEPDHQLSPSAHAARSTIARIIANGNVVSRREIIASTGLARSTIDGHLQVLLGAQLIVEAGTPGIPARGRPAQTFTINPDRGVVLVADISIDQVTIAITTLDKQMLGQRTIRVEVSRGPDEVVELMFQAFDDLLNDVGKNGAEPLAISVGIPGPVDSRRGIVVRPPLMPGWDGFEACRFMADRFNCDAVVDNAVNLKSLGEARSLSDDKLPLLLIDIGTGIGGGFVSESGLLLHGVDGSAGDIGHLRASGSSDVLCSCGNRGCLSAVGSVDAMAARLGEALGRQVSPRELIDQLSRGDATTVNIVREVASVIGVAIADLVNFCNPARVVIGGEVTRCTDDVLSQIRSVVYQQAQPLATRNLSIVHTELGDEAGLIGGMVSAIEQVLSPRGIQYHTRPAGSEMKPLGKP
ncbi:MAG: ROK family protein [Pseudolysinimonas sp.]